MPSKLASPFLCLALSICAAQIKPDADVVVIGAGVAGMATALEAASRGATVKVVEMSSVFGGHAVMSEGGLALVNTPTQWRLGVNDSAELARQDFVRWGGNPNIAWVERYVRDSSAEVHDWLVNMGLQFTVLRRPAGNSVPRFHENAERGLGVAKVLVLECLRRPNVEFVWNTQAVGIIRESGAVAGVECLHLRTGKKTAIRTPAAVLATGGFQSNVEFLRRHWPLRWRFRNVCLPVRG